MSLVWLAVVSLTCLSISVDAGGIGVTSFGPCKKPTLKSNFDINQYAGLWYEYQRFPVSFETGLGCVQAYYSSLGTKVGKTQINVTNAGTYDSSPTTANIIYGSALVTGISGLLKVKFSSAGAPYAQYKVIDTDYTTYACVYSCINLFVARIEFAWILVRDPDFSDATVLAAAKKKFSDYNIDTANFINVTQGILSCASRYKISATSG